MKFGIVFHPGLEGGVAIARKVIKFLEGKKQTVHIEKNSASLLGKKGLPLNKMKMDILVTIGGDGTILHALQNTDSKIFGINAGVLGFLTEVSSQEAVPALKNVIDGRYVVEERMRLKTVLNGKRLRDCVNEVVLHTNQIAKMRHFEIFIGTHLAQDIRADGVILATPTGSTSYAMSVGGPLIDPRVDAFVIAPIAPFKLSARPIVVGADSKIRIRLIKPGRNCLLVLDGQEELEVSDDDTLEFGKSEKEARFVRFDLDFYARVKRKLAAQ